MIELHNIDRAYFGGDLFNTVVDLKPPFFNLAFKGLYGLNIPLEIIDGNHDKYDPLYKVMEPFSSFARIHSVPEGFYDKDLGLRMVFLPFQREYDEAVSTINKLLKEEQESLVFMHQGIQGKVIDPLAVPKHLFNKKHVQKVFGGHYHFKFEEKVGNDEQKLIYPGSIISLHFGDSFASRYAVIYDTKKKEVEWLENPYTPYFISMKQQHIFQLKDKLEDIASSSYLRVELGAGEELKINVSFLMKFKGYTVSENTSQSQMFKTDSGNMPTQMDYSNFAGTVDASSTLSLDLTPEDFHNLIMTANEDATLLKQTNDKVLQQVLNEAYQLGIR